MMSKKQIKQQVKLMLVLMIIAYGCNKPEQRLLPELKTSIELVNQSWLMIDHAKEELWPDWDNYKDIPYFTAIVEQQELLINPYKTLPDSNFVLIYENKYPFEVYAKFSSEMKKIWGGTYRYKVDGKRYRGAQFQAKRTEYTDKCYEAVIKKALPDDSLKYRELIYSDNYYKRIIIHEAFHLFQYAKNKKKMVNEQHPSSFSPNNKFQHLANKEALLLANCYQCVDTAKLKKLARDFLVIRNLRREYLTDSDIKWEKRNEYVEGTAMYIETNVFKTIDPHYYNLLSELRYEQIIKSARLYDDAEMAIDRHYFFGLVIADMLDKLEVKYWKTKIIQDDDLYLEDLLEEAL